MIKEHSLNLICKNCKSLKKGRTGNFYCIKIYTNKCLKSRSVYNVKLYMSNEEYLLLRKALKCYKNNNINTINNNMNNVIIDTIMINDMIL